MGKQIMSEYTAEDFAGCLLECGPHERGGPIGGTINFNQYYNRIWCYYNQHLREPRDRESTDRRSPRSRWVAFYNEYFEWVNKS